MIPKSYDKIIKVVWSLGNVWGESCLIILATSFSGQAQGRNPGGTRSYYDLPVGLRSYYDSSPSWVILLIWFPGRHEFLWSSPRKEPLPTLFSSAGGKKKKNSVKKKRTQGLNYISPWEVLEGSEGNGDCWVEMSSRDVAGGENNYHDGESSRGGEAD